MGRAGHMIRPDSRISPSSAAGLQAARRPGRPRSAGCRSLLHEMKPEKFSPAHHLPGLAELVCSNSLRGESLENAVGLLKEELRRLGALFMEAADATRVPAGGALAVDRELFSAYISRQRSRRSSPDRGHPRRGHRDSPPDGIVDHRFRAPDQRCPGREASAISPATYLYFYDAIAPIVTADSIDHDRVFRASRYGKGEGDDYLNCPLDRRGVPCFRRGNPGRGKGPLPGVRKGGTL